jgi:hypothetical protein
LQAALLLLTSLSVPDKLLLHAAAAQPWLASRPIDLEAIHCIVKCDKWEELQMQAQV